MDYKTCSEYSLIVENLAFSWNAPNNIVEEANEISVCYLNLISSSSWTLSGVNFTIAPGELVIVIGSVGSGKTSLFMGILKELYVLDGSIAKNGDIALAAEVPWIISGTIKENILMGAEYKEEWYNEVIKVCSLEQDLDLFKEYRDETMIGDRGITLSGGQKARVSLARAVYTNREIYLLDDPLSAVDAEVASAIFTQCIKGTLKKKSVILATHQTHFASQADKILILDQGTQVFFGTYSELQDGGYSRYLGEMIQTSEKKTKDEGGYNEELPQETKVAIKDIKSILEEERAEGEVPLTVYWEYLMLGYKHWVFFFVMILFESASQIAYIVSILVYLLLDRF